MVFEHLSGKEVSICLLCDLEDEHGCVGDNPVREPIAEGTLKEITDEYFVFSDHKPVLRRYFSQQGRSRSFNERYNIHSEGKVYTLSAVRTD